MKKIYTILIFSLFSFNILSSQSVVWEKVFSFDDSLKLSGVSVRQTSDGGFLVCASINNEHRAAIVKFNNNGDHQWHQIIEVKDNIIPKIAHENDMREMMFVGLYNVYGTNLSNLYLFKTDLKGVEIFNINQDRLTNPIYNWRAAATISKDNYYLISSERWRNDTSYTELKKFDRYGYFIWEWQYDTLTRTHYYDNYVAALTQGSEESYALYGEEKTPTTQGVFVIKTNKHGVRQWRKLFENALEITPLNIISHEDGGFVLSGVYNISTDTYERYSLFMKKIDSLGALVWEKEFTQSGIIGGSGLCLSGTEESVFAGYTNKIVSGNKINNFYILKTDRRGRKEWDKIWNYDVSKDNELNDAIIAFDKNLVVTGRCGNKIYIAKIKNTTVAVEGSQIEKSSVLDIYPNPCSSILNIHYYLQYPSNVQIELRDILGRCVYLSSILEQAGNNNFSINIRDLTEGIYFVIFKTGDDVITKKVIVYEQ